MSLKTSTFDGVYRNAIIKVFNISTSTHLAKHIAYKATKHPATHATCPQRARATTHKSQATCHKHGYTQRHTAARRHTRCLHANLPCEQLPWQEHASIPDRLEDLDNQCHPVTTYLVIENRVNNPETVCDILKYASEQWKTALEG